MKSSVIYQFLEEQASMESDSDYGCKMGSTMEPAYLRMLGRSASFSYVFTRSSYSVLDLSFSLYHDFLYTGVSSYFDQLDKKIYIFIESGSATPGPPLGTLLAQHGMGVGIFCSEFNGSTRSLGFQMMVRAMMDWSPSLGVGSCEFTMEAPSASFFVGHCLDYYDGSGSYLPEGFMSLSSIVEMALFKFPELELSVSCSILMGTALSMGVTVGL